MRRNGDTNTKTYFRSERLIEEAGQWFFCTREGKLEGPFDDRVEALIKLDNYVKLMASRFTGNLDDSAVTPDD